MSLTANFDYCVEMTIEKVREIFHLAFKSEDRYPHNIEKQIPFGGHTVDISVRVLDDEDRASSLDFQDEKHMLFSFPFDLTAETPDAPDPSLSRITMQVRVEVPGKLDHWPEEDEEVLGITFEDIQPDDVNIVTLDGLPTIDINNVVNAIHNKYDQIDHVYPDAGTGSTLILYDGTRDTTLSPPNAATPFEIQGVQETHGSDEYLKVTLPIHVSINLPGGTTYTSYGNIVFWRRFIQTDTEITIQMGAEPADAALATQVNLDHTASIQAAEEAEIQAEIHARYNSVLHQYNYLGNTLIVYNGNSDPALIPPNAATPFEIEADLEMHSGTEYLKVTLPIYVSVPSALNYTSFGRIRFWRAVTRTPATTINVNMGADPGIPALATVVELDAPGGAAIAPFIQPMFNSAIGAFGTVSGPSFEVVRQQIRTQAMGAINNFGTVVEPAPSEATARSMLQEQIADYLRPRQYPVYSPKSPDPDEPLSTPVGFLLVSDGILAILMNRRTGTEADDHAPDDFLGGNDMALAVSRDKIFEYIDDTVEELFPGLNGSDGNYSGSHLVETDDGDATLKEMHISLADPGSHDESEGHFWVTGETEVHIDCWPDPDVSFEGPIFLDAITGTDEEGNCTFRMEAVPGDFDIDQSCCSCIINWLIPIVGPIMHFVVENTVEEVGGELVEDYAEGQERHIDAIPPVVNGIAEVQACLVDVNIRSDGLILPGTLAIRRLGRSFEDLEEDRDAPRP
jgi:hypothetical protein